MKNKSYFFSSLCCLSFCGALCFTAIDKSYALDPTVVVPNGARDAEANGANAFPFDIGSQFSSMRYQQVYAASQFSTIGSGGLITQIIFRPDGSISQAFNSVLPDMQINLSTTPAADDALSLVFANNIGSDDTVVFAGALSLSSANVGGPPKDFDIVINLTTPFFYDPSMGNLLLDVRNFAGGSTTFFDVADTRRDGVSRISTNSVNGVNQAVANFEDSEGLVTGFTITANGLALTSAASELGGFEVSLPGIECRSAGARKQYQVIFTFNHNITSVGDANTSCGGVASPTIDSSDPRRVILDLTRVFCNGADVTINLSDLTDDQGETLAAASTVMTLLEGDVTGDGTVDQGDVAEVKMHRGELTDDSNFRDDVNVDGQINSADIRLVRSASTTLP